MAQRNPLQLGSALQMAALFQVVLMAVFVARETWGTSGVFTSAAVLGLMLVALGSAGVFLLR